MCDVYMCLMQTQTILQNDILTESKIRMTHTMKIVKEHTAIYYPTHMGNSVMGTNRMTNRMGVQWWGVGPIGWGDQ